MAETFFSLQDGTKPAAVARESEEIVERRACFDRSKLGAKPRSKSP